MDLEVVGRHAMLFDDDAMAAFVNTTDALVDWNSLSIDRYDVRHLLPNPPPSLKRRHNLTRSTSPPFLPDSSLEQDLDHERYLDLPPTSDEQVQDVNKDAVMMDTTGYRAVAFSYGNPDESTEQKDTAAESIFHPSFPVPESLIQNLPPTEKVHQIIARTALFVSKQGGQSEIILRVKQGDNPTFGFLMPDHHLHAYFRFLVDHQELLKSDDGKSLEEEKKTDNGLDQRGGALSLLGSLYGSGEDEDGITDGAPEVKYAKPEETVDAVSVNVSQGSELKESSGNVVATDDVVSGNILPLKEKDHVLKRNRSITTVKGGAATLIKKEKFAAANKSQASAVVPSTSKIELPIVEPPSDLKRVVEKIVEFILKNGREFEAVLAEQDRKFGRFLFLLPSNQYHPYYLKVLEETQEAKLLGKGHISEKRDSMGHGIEKKPALSKEGDTFTSSSADPDGLYEYDRKEKFKMVIGKSKKDGQDPPVKANQPQVGVSVDAAAAILKAATRGIKNPSLEMLSKSSSSGIGRGPSDEGGYSSSFGSLHTSQLQSSIKKVDENGEPSVSVPVAKAIAETAALAAASEADSSEASLTREQKLKAERLKRAKMFAAMLKGGAAPSPLNSEPLRGLSVEPPGSGVSSGTEGINLASKEREGSSVPFDVNTLDKNETSEIKISMDECNERRSKRSYRSRSKRHEGEGEEEEDDDDDDELGKEGEDKHRRDHKHSRKKHRSHRSSHHSKDRHKHRKRHSSSKDRESQQHNEHDSYSGDEHQQSPHQSKYDNSDGEHWPSKRRKRHSPSDSERCHARHRHKHVSSSDDEHRHSRRQHRHGGSSEDEQSRTRRRHKHRSPPGGENHSRNRSSRHSKSHSKRELEIEEGEICAKSDQSKASESERASREASVDLSKSYQHGRAPSQPAESTDVSDDLRAKIRAMLMATL